MPETEAFYERADVSLLAKTPAIIPARTWTSNQDWEDARNYLEQTLTGLRNWRTPWWMHWGAIAANTLPRRYFWVVTPNNMTRGLPINQDVVDSTPTQALNVCAAGMMDGLSNEEKIWFKFQPAIVGYEPDTAGKRWISEFQKRTYEVLAGSNYYDAKYQYYEDQILFGTAPLLIYEDRERIVSFQNSAAGEYFGACAHGDEVDVFNREFVLTVRQIVERFGAKALAGTDVAEQWNTKTALDREFIVCHSIEPNFPMAQYGQPSKLGVIPGGFPYREYYWLKGISTPRPLSARGFHEKPFMYGRWTVRGNDAYGRGAGMDALPDTRQLHQLTRRESEGIDKGLRPPMMADMAMKNEPSSGLPGKVTYVPNLAQSPGMKPMYTVDPRFVELAEKKIEALQQRIERWYFNDVFLMISQMEGVQPRNELELSERRGEKLLRLGSVIGRNLRQDAICLKRVVNIMLRRGLIPPKPQSMRGVPIELKFVSKLALIQQAAKTAGMERTMVMAGRMEGAMPGTLDNINGDKFIRDYGEAVEFPPEDWADETKMKQTRAAKAQVQQGAQQMHAAEKVTPALAQAAQNLSETDTGGGLNALQMLLGSGGQGAAAGK